MCERKAENYSAGTSLVIIPCPRSSLPKMGEPAGTQEAELGPEGFGALVKEMDLEISTEFPHVQCYFGAGLSL